MAARRVDRADERLRGAGYVGIARVLRRISQRRPAPEPNASAARLLRRAHLSTQRQRERRAIRAYRLGQTMKGRFTAVVLLFFAVTLQAQRLPRTVFPVHYDLSFAPNLANAIFDGDETIEVSVEQPTTSIKLHAMDITFNEVTINDQKASVAEDKPNEMVALNVANPIAIGPAKIHIRYSGTLNKDLRGLYIGEANGRKYASTQFEVAAARYGFPSFDE